MLSPVGVPVLRVVTSGERIATTQAPSAAELLDDEDEQADANDPRHRRA